MLDTLPRKTRGKARVPSVAIAALIIAGCGLTSGASGSGPGSKVEVAAAENFWGSIAAQLGGAHAHVTSIIANPATDPHAYEARPDDARAMAAARYVVINGAGYDPWAPKLLAANPVSGRVVLNVAELVSKKEGDNPHLWYSPDYVGRVIDRISTDLERIDPADAAYFDQQNTLYRTVALKEYHAAIETIKQKYSGVPAGATESIFAYLAQATGLNLITPPEYMKAISEGAEPTANDKVTIGRQIATKQFRVFVFNAQNATPEVSALVNKARSEQVPVVAVTETLAPAGTTFQDWQTSQLKALLLALGG